MDFSSFINNIHVLSKNIRILITVKKYLKKRCIAFIESYNFIHSNTFRRYSIRV